MFCKLISYTLIGLSPQLVSVEVDLSDGLPCFDIVGLPDSAVRESKERVKSALRNSGYTFPIKRITVNLAPADVRKEGSLYDLPIALGILCASGHLTSEKLTTLFCAGELSLDGHLRQTNGLIPILCTLQAASSLPCIVPAPNYHEIAPLDFKNIFYFSHLSEVITYINKGTLPCFTPPPLAATPPLPKLDFCEVSGQEDAKYALMIAAAGFHNILFIGPPGVGKTMLVKRLPSILPELSKKELLELTQIYSISNKRVGYLNTLERPFRAPHHTITTQGLTGGGAHPKPGEISLAHLGILFLDELLEFNKKTLEVLRQSLEDGEITLSRVHQNITYPARFLLAAACNPCPCGYYPDDKRCSCDIPSIKRYLSKLSGPLLDRISIHLELQPVSFETLETTPSLSSAEMKASVVYARQIQQQRFAGTGLTYNSQIPTHMLESYCSLTPPARKLLEDWFHLVGASARAHTHIICLARTIADLSGKLVIDEDALAKAIQYRLLDRRFFN